jgi:RNA polymerase sigma-70 factor (ECF subfamily)
VRSSRAEFEAALLPHLEAMARLARFLMRGNQADADDLVQDAVLRAFQAFPRFRPGTNFRAWLFRILRNAHVDLLRKRGHRAEVAGLEELVVESDAAVEEFRARAARERASADLEIALATLPAEVRLALLLVDGEGMRYDEVAEVMGCPVGTVRSRLHRGRRLLRQQLFEVWQKKVSS